APGRAAKTAQVPVAANAKGVDLAPSQDLLAHGTAPYYIDPDFIPVSEDGYAWTWVQSAYQTTPNWMQSGSADSAHPGVGVCGYYAAGGSCPNDVERTFYQFNVSGIEGDVIGNATVTLQEYVSADWSCSNTYPLDLYWTTSISNSTSWSNQPTKQSGSLGTDQVGGSGQSACHDNVPFAYTVTSAVQSNANANNGTITFGVYGDESNANAFKRLTYQPSISVTYDRTPNVPTGAKTSPEPKLVSPSQTYEACENSPMSSWGWLGAGSDQANAVSLTATVSSPVQAQLYGQASVWDDSANGTGVFWGPTALTASGGTASVSLPAGTLKDGHDYGWYMYAFDNVPNVPWSSPSTVCHFRVDLTPPKLSLGSTGNNYTSSQFPPSGSGIASTVYVGQQGYIPFTATDPTPAGGGDVSGVACVIYGFDPLLADGTAVCGSSLSSNQIPVTASHWGTNIVYARAEDNAGNLSPITSYSFYVPWNPLGTKPVFGDVTGDGVPKIVTPDSAGNLRAFSVPGNPLAPKGVDFVSAKPNNTPPVDGSLTGASAGDSWANYQTTHRGSLSGGVNVDDLFVHKPGSLTLYWYKNVGNTSGIPGKFDSLNHVTKPDCDATQTDCTGYVKDWSTTLEIAASGDPTTSVLNAGTFKDLTGLFTIETNTLGDGSLWYYPGIGNGALGTPKRVVPTGMKGWNLISPGDWAQQPNQSQPGLWVRNPGSGDLRGYTLTPGTVNVPNPVGTGSTALPTFTGVAGNVLIGCGITAAAYPRVGSDGDLTGNGHSTLWGITPSGDVRIWTGSPNYPATTGSSCSPGYTWTASSVVLNTAFGADRWSLTGSSTNNGVANDTSTLAPATINGSVSWTTGPNNTAQGAANFSGGGYLRTKAPVVDSSQSYTLSAWAYLGSAPSANQTVLAEGGSNHQAFYLWYTTDNGANTWGFTTTGSDNPSTTWSGVQSTIKPNIGNWDHLVATYSVDTHVMTLYVNGKFAGSATNTSPWKAPNGLSIGASANTDGSSYNNLTNGAVTDVRTFPYALTAEQVTAL
ncbi:LamG domain-containing protein, partial [Kitasatospora sp. NPDC093558]|uniref:LamG domain-containing protein n=1 Tax=Kitasatospora sp. NPDC093558 TaxID=3155201 RepID=UPI003438B491